MALVQVSHIMRAYFHFTATAFDAVVDGTKGAWFGELQAVRHINRKG
jgi:hypothetical protein